MAKQDFSFDIVSEVSMPEVANAVDQARREIAQRFDFKDTGTSLSQDDQLIEVRSSTEDRLKAAVVKSAAGQTTLENEINALLGKPWDDQLETFRYAGDGAPVRWLHQVV